MVPLLELRGPDAIKRSSEVSQYHDQLCNKVKVFREAHELYSEQLLADSNEKDLDNTLKSLDDYYTEVDTKYYEFSKKYDIFKTECEIICLKVDLEASIEDYISIEKVFKTQYEKYETKTIIELETCVDIKHIAALELKNKLSETFLKISSESKKLRKASVSLDKFRTHHFEIIQAELSFDLNKAHEIQPTFIEYLNNIISIQNQLKDMAAAKPSEVVLSSVPDSMCPIKLQKVDNIRFNGESRDFATFKYKFETIVVPNRPAHDIGLRLQDAVPDKHRHLVERFKLDQWKDMMNELDKNFRGSNQSILFIPN